MAYEDEHFIDTTKPVWNYSFFTDQDVSSFSLGKLFTAHEKFGSHSLTVLGKPGFYFAVWAPNATEVSVIGEFNGWKKKLHKLYVRLDKSGIWEGFIPSIPAGSLYKYQITGYKGIETFKADPYGRYCELRPATASVTWHSSFKWNDDDWMQNRKINNSLNSPWSVYEVHLGSWMRPLKNNENLFNNYIEITERLVPYVSEMGFTHVEIMPVMEHPYDGSWGYQGTGYFAATSRYGNPDGFAHLVNAFHNNQIGVILDWVPSHFPHDAHGLYLFDGAHTYEYEDMRKGFHPDWNSYIFNYKRGEVQSFLLSSAFYWLKEFHADGLRVDAVNSILRLDYSRNAGEWEPNERGGNENLEAIDFLKDLNRIVYHEFPDVQTIAEEASDWPGITSPLHKKGFGFGMKWMMGWMHDSFKYFKMQPTDRLLHQHNFTFSMMYYYDEHFMLPISHDEIVHGKSPMVYKMPGNEIQQFANLRLFYTYMFTHPGAKLLFMGNEFGQTTEWNINSELDWELLQYAPHNKLQNCIKDLNHIYRYNPSMYEYQFDRKGFEWVYLNMEDEGIMVYKRKGHNQMGDILVILNVSNNVYKNKSLRIKGKIAWREIFNSNKLDYWGTGANINTEPQITIVDKKSKLCEIIIDIHSLTAMIFM
ncbi:MAG: 1,4-alpha-glucan branching protein GlgB [Ferruginibacter sp.]